METLRNLNKHYRHDFRSTYGMYIAAPMLKICYYPTNSKESCTYAHGDLYNGHNLCTYNEKLFMITRKSISYGHVLL